MIVKICSFCVILIIVYNEIYLPANKEFETAKGVSAAEAANAANNEEAMLDIGTSTPKTSHEARCIKQRWQKN